MDPWRSADLITIYRHHCCCLCYCPYLQTMPTNPCIQSFLEHAQAPTAAPRMKSSAEPLCKSKAHLLPMHTHSHTHTHTYTIFSSPAAKCQVENELGGKGWDDKVRGRGCAHTAVECHPGAALLPQALLPQDCQPLGGQS